MSFVSARASLFALVLAVGAMACAEASSEFDGGTGFDALVNPNVDARVNDASSTPTIDAQQGTPDAGSTCPSAPCDLVQQCGCSSPQVCDLDSAALPSGGTECRDVLNPGNEDDDCGGVFDCASGHVCIGGTCRKYCNVDPDCSGDGGICIVQLTFGDPATDIPGAITCTRSCNPTLPASNGCPPSEQACHVFQYDPNGIADDGDEVLLTDCTPSGTAGNDATCTSGGNECLPGYDCVNTGSLVCKQNCVMPGGTCAVGACTGYTEPLLINGTEYGVCI